MSSNVTFMASSKDEICPPFSRWWRWAIAASCVLLMGFSQVYESLALGQVDVVELMEVKRVVNGGCGELQAHHLGEVVERDQAFGPLQAEPFAAHVFAPQEGLEGVGRDQTLQNPLAFRR